MSRLKSNMLTHSTGIYKTTMKDKFCFCTLAFGDGRYIEQMVRLKQSIHTIYPDATIFSWTNSYPEGSKPHKHSPYGFKVHAINHARKAGYKKIIWLDTACMLIDKVDYWFTLIDTYGVVAAKDDSKLSGCIGDNALSYYGNPDITGYHLVGGSLYVFDFDNELTQKIFTDWEDAEANGVFRDERKHRHDEAAMAMALYRNGSTPTPYDVCRYNNGPSSVVIKNHFK
jgi:hypothetical protein